MTHLEEVEWVTKEGVVVVVGVEAHTVFKSQCLDSNISRNLDGAPKNFGRARTYSRGSRDLAGH